MKKGLFTLKPQGAAKWNRFKEIRRGYWSLLAILFFLVLSFLGPVLVGSRALAVRYSGEWTFPVLSGYHPGTTFGLDSPLEPDYLLLQEVFAKEGAGNTVLMPLVPFDPRAVSDLVVPLSGSEEGYLREDGSAFMEGRAFTRHAGGQKHRVFMIQNGQLSGIMSEYDPDGVKVGKARYAKGELVEGSFKALEPGIESTLDAASFDRLETYVAFPSAPGVAGHILGTDESGRDVLARLFGGFRIMMVASGIFIVCTYFLGIVVGCFMGYFGGAFDMASQRFVEIWSAIPFLYIVIILSAFITPNLYTLLGIMIAFSWMGLTYFMRTATYREKVRDYVSAGRVMGASPARIIFIHILPNALSTLITFVPFTVAGLIGSLTALDFLGFGLPPTEPSWGDLLKQGTANMDSPWILYSVVTCLAVLLILITFVGEAIREAFDPKKYTYYK